MNTTHQQSADVRLQDIKLRRAEIKVSLTASKHAYFASGIERPLSERTALEAEDAELALEALRIGHDAVKARAFRRIVTNADLLSHLLRVLDEKGLWALAVEASQRSTVELASITPWRAESQPADAEA